MRSERLNRRSFRDILVRVADANASELMRRARRANRLAKTLEGRSRRAAYAVKHDALLALKVRFPERVRIAEDPANPLFVLVKVEAARFGLHAPELYFAERGHLPLVA